MPVWLKGNAGRLSAFLQTGSILRATATKSIMRIILKKMGPS